MFGGSLYFLNGVCPFCVFFFFFSSDRLFSVCLPFPLSDNCVFTASLLGAGECHNTFPEPGRGWLEGGPGAEEGAQIPCSSPVLDVVQLTDTWCEMLDPLCPFFFLRIGKGCCHQDILPAASVLQEPF